ncbi:conjugal transfer protein TraF [Shewanella sp. NIFS-20-20]|uniref:conjugal transfer protein TraF n=1 Tax=Shewanella sp. NIFS-20-20 TaxID=2853806 RepID=UPI001C44A6EE|nr:conjugal transfer protein TraF [Shewanella sp. NIFS-20-20]MBV7315282.1 conjugal transfer protein TraF [Shewanella sp. NIFS-20-20]
MILRKGLALLMAFSMCAVAIAGQAEIDARSAAMGGVGVASSHKAASVFYNPALLAKPDLRDDDVDLLLPALSASYSDRHDLQASFDRVQDNYQGLNQAIDNGDMGQIDAYRQRLIITLDELSGDSAYANVAVGAAIAFPTHPFPTALFYQTYVEGMGVADVTQSDIDALSSLDPDNPPESRTLTSSGTAVAGAVSEFGVALSYPLSIVNMPVTIGISPKIQRLDSFNYVANVTSFDRDDIREDRYRSNNTQFNLDAGITIMPTRELTIGLSGRDLVQHKLDSLVIDDRQFSFTSEAKFTLGVAWDWRQWMLSSDIDLNKRTPFDGMGSSQYWRVGGAVQATDWLSLRVGYRYDIEANHDDIYTLGSGMTFGRIFSIDVAGMFGTGDSLGAAVQTRYQF